MRTLKWLVTISVIVTQTLAMEAEFLYGFSDCVDDERTLFYYTNNEGMCSVNTTGQVLAKPPVHGLRCDIHCDQGYYLGANFSNLVPVSACERCPQGKYSLGGGKLFSQRTDAWTLPLSAELQTDCVTQDMYTGQWKHNCNPWVSSADGSYISSGENSQVMEQFSGLRLYSSLRVSATFVRNGSVTYKYRVDAEEPYDGLIFQIDQNQSVKLMSQSNGWKEMTVKVPVGSHTFAWNYVKDYVGDVGEDKAFLKVIELVGTAWSDLRCHTCGGDMTNTGGSLCAFCGPNEYAAAKSNSELEFKCYTCPDNTFAPKGSIGISSCVEQRPCSMDDVNATYTACQNGTRDVQYSWSEPQTCDVTLNQSIALPAPQNGVECASCARGYQLTGKDECVACGANKILSASEVCTECPAGKVVVNALEFSKDTPDAWDSWPSIFDSEASSHAGWKLTKSGLLFAQHTTSDEENGNWIRPSHSALTFSVPFVHSGSLNVTYTLNGLPTFGDDGFRAWVELEIRDLNASNKQKYVRDIVISNSSGSKDGSSKTSEDESIVHLLHGGENGTFSEVIPINLTTGVTKEFAFVVRATTPEAKRRIEAKVIYLGFTGTRDGAGVSCDSCPAGYHPITSEDYGCRICPAGTFAKVDDVTGVVACSDCPANTYSKAGASGCIPCGSNTYSKSGSATCAAPQALTLDADTVKMSSSSSMADAVSSALDGLQVTYNLSLLESLVWGNESRFLADIVYGNTTSLQSIHPVNAPMVFQADIENYWFTGLFRPLGTGWLEQVPGQIVDQQVDTNHEVAHVVFATMTNPQDAGNYFQQNSGVYGNVLCSAPSQWKLVNGGSHMDILPLESGAGVKVSFTNGSACVNGKTMTTIFHFECDLNSGTITKPTSASIDDDDECEWNIVWKTAYACPVCDDDYFSELRSTCNGGEQLVSYARKLECYGGSESASTETISTCTESAVVLDTKALYSVYAMIVVVGFIVLVLLMGILIIHRKYRNVYNDYLYLKGKLPTEERMQGDGSKETTFEFTPTSNALHSSPLGLASSRATPERVEGISDVDLNDEGIDLQLKNMQSV
ncbi:putative tyrosine-protein kinase ephrin type A/B receptor [Plasmopara halstedii]